MKKILCLISSATLLVGCVNADAVRSITVDDAKDSEIINGATVSCSGLGITRDCNLTQGATRVISVEGRSMRVASNDSGTAILMMFDNEVCGITQTECMTKESNSNYLSLKDFYVNRSINIESVQPVAASDFIAGYYFSLSQDGYSYF